MVEIEDADGRVVRVPRQRIVAVYTAGASSQWRGTQSIVMVDGLKHPIESRTDAQTIADRCHAAEAAALGDE